MKKNSEVTNWKHNRFKSHLTQLKTQFDYQYYYYEYNIIKKNFNIINKGTTSNNFYFYIEFDLNVLIKLQDVGIYSLDNGRLLDFFKLRLN